LEEKKDPTIDTEEQGKNAVSILLKNILIPLGKLNKLDEIFGLFDEAIINQPFIKEAHYE